MTERSGATDGTLKRPFTFEPVPNTGEVWLIDAAGERVARVAWRPWAEALVSALSETATFNDGVEAAAALADLPPFSGTDLSRRIRALKHAARQAESASPKETK